MTERRHNDGLRKLCRCGRDRWAKCTHPIHFNYKGVRFSLDVQEGRPIRLWKEAKTLARDYREAIDNGTFVRRERGGPEAVDRKAAAEAKKFTFKDFATKYEAEYSTLKDAGKARKDKFCDDHYRFATMCAFALGDGRKLGRVPFAEVTETMYEQYVSSRRADDYAASTVNKDVNLIKRMCKWATKRKLYGPRGDNPLSDESKILVRKAVAQRQRRITDTELEAIKTVADRMLWAFIELALITCLRLTELYRLRWDDVDFDAFTVRIRPEATKTEAAKRLAPLDNRALAILKWLRIDPAGREYPGDAFVFGECGERQSGSTTVSTRPCSRRFRQRTSTATL